MVEIQAGEPTQTEFTSKITPIILGEVSKIAPAERVREVSGLLHDIDQQGVNNFKQFEGPKGSIFPYTSIDVTRLALDHFGKDYTEKPKELRADPETERLTDFLFTGHHPQFGDPFLYWRETVDRTMHLLPHVMNAVKHGRPIPEVRVVVPGLPRGFGGKVTSEWNADVKERGFVPYGEAYAALLQHMLGETPLGAKATTDQKRTDTGRDTGDHVILNGASMGVRTTQETYRMLPDVWKERVQILLEDPVAEYFGDESADSRGDKRSNLKLRLVPNLVHIRPLLALMKREPAMYKALEGQFRERGMNPYIDPENLKLKEIATDVEYESLTKVVDPADDIRAHRQRGIMDTGSFAPRNALRSFVARYTPHVTYSEREQGKVEEEGVVGQLKAVAHTIKHPTIGNYLASQQVGQATEHMVRKLHFTNPIDKTHIKKWFKLIDSCKRPGSVPQGTIPSSTS